MSFDQVILLLSLISGSIYATASLTVKIFRTFAKEKGLMPQPICPFFPYRQ